jgi:hypothetical protein
MKDELFKEASGLVAEVNKELSELENLKKGKADTDAKVAELKQAEQAILDSEDVGKLLQHRAKLDVASNKAGKQASEIVRQEKQTIEAGISASAALNRFRDGIAQACKARLKGILLSIFGEPRKSHVAHALELCEDWMAINKSGAPGFSKAIVEIGF